MAFIVEIAPNIYEKRTSTIRVFGGRFQYTGNVEEAKRLTRQHDAETRASLLRQHLGGHYAYKKQYQPNLDLIQYCIVKEV